MLAQAALRHLLLVHEQQGGGKSCTSREDTEKATAAHSVRMMLPEPPPPWSREAGVSGPAPPGPISMLSPRSSPTIHVWNLSQCSSMC